MELAKKYEKAISAKQVIRFSLRGKTRRKQLQSACEVNTENSLIPSNDDDDCESMKCEEIPCIIGDKITLGFVGISSVKPKKI